MKHIKLYEDYSDEEIKGLMGDLADVGLQEKWRVVGRISTVTPEDKYYGNWDEQVHEVFITDVVADTEEAAYEEAFNNLKAGKFTQNLGGGGNYGIFKVVPEVKQILSKENIIKSANGKADSQPMKTQDIIGKPINYGKLRWLLTVDLLAPTEEATLDNIKKYDQLSPEIEDHVTGNTGWNLYADKI